VALHKISTAAIAPRMLRSRMQPKARDAGRSIGNVRLGPLANQDFFDEGAQNCGARGSPRRAFLQCALAALKSDS
jgi:hypothetical protein